MEHRTGAVLCKMFQEVWGTFRGKKVHFCEFFGKKLPFWQFSKGRHGLQFWPFDNPISRATLMELELLCAGGFGGSLTHLGVKKSVLVHFLMIFWIFLGSLLCAFGNICIKELLNIYLSTFTFFICAKKRHFNTPPLVVSLCLNRHNNIDKDFNSSYQM